MIAYSDEKPETFVLIGGKYHFNYNISEETVNDEFANKVKTQFKFDFVVVDNIDRRTLIDVVITDTYSYSRQIGKAALPPGRERDEYYSFVESAKRLVDEALTL